MSNKPRQTSNNHSGLTVHLDVDKARAYEGVVAVDSHVSLELLLIENGFWVQDLPVSDPEVILDNTSSTNQSTVDELVNEVPRG